MSQAASPLGFGIEEEYLLVDLSSRDVPTCAPQGLVKACRHIFGAQLAEEMFQCQLELTTPVLHDLNEARACLVQQRTRLAEVMPEFGLGLVSVGAHPFANGLATRNTDSPRYRFLFEDYRLIARSSLLCGLHVHVGVPEGQDRIRLMNQLLHWLPPLLALSASSPFWLGEPTGSMSYRRAICGQWPRMELPDEFPSETAFQAYVGWLLGSGSIRSENDIWWLIRPSARFPTLELRITDACPSVEDAICIAGLFRTFVAHALAHPQPRPGRKQRLVVTENYWRARQQGIHARYLDETGCNARDISAWLDLAEERFGETAHALGDQGAFTQARRIAQSGGSADRQLDWYRQGLSRGSSTRQALHAVVDGLRAEFSEGWTQPGKNPEP